MPVAAEIPLTDLLTMIILLLVHPAPAGPGHTPVRLAPVKIFTLAGPVLPVAVLETLVGGGNMPSVRRGVGGELVVPGEVAAGMAAAFVRLVACWMVEDER